MFRRGLTAIDVCLIASNALSTGSLDQLSAHVPMEPRAPRRSLPSAAARARRALPWAFLLLAGASMLYTAVFEEPPAGKPRRSPGDGSSVVSLAAAAAAGARSLLERTGAGQHPGIFGVRPAVDWEALDWEAAESASAVVSR